MVSATGRNIRKLHGHQSIQIVDSCHTSHLKDTSTVVVHQKSLPLLTDLRNNMVLSSLSEPSPTSHAGEARSTIYKPSIFCELQNSGPRFETLYTTQEGARVRTVRTILNIQNIMSMPSIFCELQNSGPRFETLYTTQEGARVRTVRTILNIQSIIMNKRQVRTTVLRMRNVDHE
jgi:hypothetical protein